MQLHQTYPTMDLIKIVFRTETRMIMKLNILLCVSCLRVRVQNRT